MRTLPNTEAEILGKLPRDFVLDVLGRSADHLWLAIAYPDFGSLGWVSAEFVTPRTGLEQFPVEGAPEPTPTPMPHNADVLPDWY